MISCVLIFKGCICVALKAKDSQVVNVVSLDNEASANDGTQTMQDNIYVYKGEGQRTDKYFAPSKDIYLEDELVGLSKYSADDLNDGNLIFSFSYVNYSPFFILTST